MRDHEQAHISSGGDLIRCGPNSEYQTGPDKKRYNVSGEVSIDTTSVNNDPEATICKAVHFIRTALAPADPSTQDLRVATDAAQMEQEAEAEERQASLDQQKNASNTSSKTQQFSNPVMDAMIRKAYGSTISKSSNSGNKSVLSIFSA